LETTTTREPPAARGAKACVNARKRLLIAAFAVFAALLGTGEVRPSRRSVSSSG
jgi:hypothetical protein